ncbi:uncharacterized protein ARMOST_17499 [Armillaria ostoyae]|uniref:Uncharacterized protein n=1 Tax=Armillaria ostoyae TaxID=47428 RepID=A0A284RZ83_ARMOS|nr:uncharacterized protein ARMOST_17499 [Armillaria ostoyae]
MPLEFLRRRRATHHEAAADVGALPPHPVLSPTPASPTISELALDPKSFQRMASPALSSESPQSSAKSLADLVVGSDIYDAILASSMKHAKLSVDPDAFMPPPSSALLAPPNTPAVAVERKN